MRAAWIFVSAFAGPGRSLFAWRVPDRITIRQAAAAPASPRFVLRGAVVVPPFIIGCTILSYRVFRGKARQSKRGA